MSRAFATPADHGAAIAREMAARGLTVQGAAVATGLTPRTVLRKLNGLSPLTIDEFVYLLRWMEWDVREACIAVLGHP